ncbi:hypothetical protein [Dyella sp. A6]|uniref:hypothetical protein n=1 Tax=Dyella aluminiiresistens TaxID=3069105 RepID=UPI002E79F9B6|nr:hypothetical protein [Dyella sp. A6]
MRFPSLHRVLLPVAAALALAACHHENPANRSGGSTPEAMVQESAQLIKEGNFAGFWKHALPPADYASMRADWKQLSKEQPPMSPDEQARFMQTVKQLTAPGAKAKLYAEIQPKLTRLETQYKDQVPVAVGIGQAIASTAIAQAKSLTDAEKKEASDVLSALLPWAQKAPWFDQTKAQQAVGVVVTTARKLDLKSPNELRTLDFDAAMAKYAQVFDGLKQALAIYGLSVDDVLDSAKATTESMDHGHAHVQINYTLLGKSLTLDTHMMLDNGRWYDQTLVDEVRQAHQQLLAREAAAKAAATPAPAGSAAPAPTASAAKPASASTAH